MCSFDYHFLSKCVIIKNSLLTCMIHSYTHNSATIWIWFICADVIAIALHILNLSDTDINAFIHITDEGFITYVFVPSCL